MRKAEPLSDEAQKEFGQALDQIFGNLLKRADEEREKTESWQNLFAASENGLRGLLNDANNQMIRIALNTTSIIQKKFGVRISGKLFDLVKALPYAMSKTRDAIQDQQGLMCCADKAREVYYQEVLEEIRNLLKEQSQEEKEQSQEEKEQSQEEKEQ